LFIQPQEAPENGLRSLDDRFSNGPLVPLEPIEKVSQPTVKRIWLSRIKKSWTDEIEWWNNTTYESIEWVALMWCEIMPKEPTRPLPAYQYFLVKETGNCVFPSSNEEHAKKMVAEDLEMSWWKK
jgi:hypothetical protein